MCDFIRLANGLSAERIPFSRPFSSFQFLSLRASDWDTTPALHRLFSQARRQRADELVVEELPAVAEIEDENSELDGLFADHKYEGAWRISFLAAGRLVGYGIVKSDSYQNGQSSHVFESVFSKYDHLHNFVPGGTEFQVRCDGHDHQVEGVMYCQQNGKNKACAQVAIRSLLSSVFPDRPLCYSDLNGIAGTQNPSNGLSTTQIRSILSQLQVSYVDLDYDTPQGQACIAKTPYHRFLYAGMESGMGGLVGFQLSNNTARHIIPFFGHTFNQDTWSPHASNAYFSVGPNTKYIPSDEWLSSFIGHDDNFGSNFCVPKRFIDRSNVKYVLSILPADIPGNPLTAEARAIDFLYKHLGAIKSTEMWADRWKKHVVAQDIVARVLLMSRDAYVDHLKTAGDWEGNQEDHAQAEKIGLILPESFWLVELSIPDLYSANYSKIGELAFSLDASGGQIEMAVLRIPGQYVIKIPGNPMLQSLPSAFTTHIPVYTTKPALLGFPPLPDTA